MGMMAAWTTRCDNCNAFIYTEIRLTVDTVQQTQGYLDIWGPGFPPGWIQVAHDKATDRHYLFFHDRDCYEDWLRKQGRVEEADAFKNAIWIA